MYLSRTHLPCYRFPGNIFCRTSVPIPCMHSSHDQVEMLFSISLIPRPSGPAFVACSTKSRGKAWKISLVPSPTPSFPSLLSTKQRRKAGRGTGNEATGRSHHVICATTVIKRHPSKTIIAAQSRTKTGEWPEESHTYTAAYPS